MTANPPDTAALLHEQFARLGRHAHEQRLKRFVEALDSLDQDQLAAVCDLTSVLERLTALLDKAAED